jgi:hypothetical protein
MLSGSRTVVVLLLLAPLSGLPPGRAAPALAVSAGDALASGNGAASGPVAVVNGESISRADFGAYLVRSLGRSARDTFVDWMLVEQEARRLGVTITDAELADRKGLEVELRLRAVLRNARMSLEEYQKVPNSPGRDMAKLRLSIAGAISDNALRTLFLAEKIIAPQLDLSEAALRDYYERTRGGQFTAAHIVVGSQRTAEDLLDLLRERPAAWSEAVLQYSLDRDSVPYKGRIGPVPAASELGRTLSAVQPGERKLYREGDLWHVVRLVSAVPPSQERFEEIKGRLKTELIAEQTPGRFESLLASLNRAACVVDNLFPEPQARRPLGAETAVFVNGEAFPVSRLEGILLQEFGPRMLSPYIERVLVFQEARRRGLVVSEEEMGARMRGIGQELFDEQAVQRRMKPQQLSTSLARTGVDIAGYKMDLVRQFVAPEDVRAELLAEKMVADGVQVSESEIREAYADLRKHRFVVRELAADSAAVAERMYRALKQGVRFDVVARTELSEPGQWQPGSLVSVVTSSHPHYSYVKDLQEGEVSGIFKQGGKYRIIEVLERCSPSEPPALDSARPTLEQEVRLRKSKARIQALLVKLKVESAIEIRLN